MPEDLTKRQHYVWRNYLKPWKLSENDAGIWTLLKERSKVAIISLMDVGQGSYFYKVNKLQPYTIQLMDTMVSQSPFSIKPFLQDMLTLYKTYNSILEEVARRKTSLDDPDIAHAIKEIEINTYEHIEGKIELMGSDFLKCSSVQDFKRLMDNDKIEDSILFMCVQYGRTKKMRINQESAFKDDEKSLSLIRDAFPFSSLYFALGMCRDLILSNNWRLIAVKNNTSIPFITGDQPIVNVAYNEETATGFELYYPTSPNTAIVLTTKDALDQFGEIMYNEDEVKAKNQIMYNNSLHHVFANNKLSLELYK